MKPNEVEDCGTGVNDGPDSTTRCNRRSRSQGLSPGLHHFVGLEAIGLSVFTEECLTPRDYSRLPYEQRSPSPLSNRLAGRRQVVGPRRLLTQDNPNRSPGGMIATTSCGRRNTDPNRMGRLQSKSSRISGRDPRKRSATRQVSIETEIHDEGVDISACFPEFAVRWRHIFDHLTPEW
jgi:hypothetical protein